MSGFAASMICTIDVFNSRNAKVGVPFNYGKKFCTAVT